MQNSVHCRIPNCARPASVDGQGEWCQDIQKRLFCLNHYPVDNTVPLQSQYDKTVMQMLTQLKSQLDQTDLTNKRIEEPTKLIQKADDKKVDSRINIKGFKSTRIKCEVKDCPMAGSFGIFVSKYNSKANRCETHKQDGQVRMSNTERRFRCIHDGCTSQVTFRHPDQPCTSCMKHAEVGMAFFIKGDPLTQADIDKVNKYTPKLEGNKRKYQHSQTYNEKRRKIANKNKNKR